MNTTATRKLPSPTTNRTAWLNVLIIAAMLIALFVVGLKLGGLFSTTAQQPITDAVAAQMAPGGAMVNPPFAVRDFTLTNQDGQPTSLQSLRGKAVVLFFGYTHCPDVCPTTLADYKRVKADLGADAARVTFAFVTVDPQRDTPARIKTYLSAFDADFMGLTADDATLQAVAAQFGAYYRVPTEAHAHSDEHQHKEGVQSENYFVDHTSPSFLIDAEGQLRMVYFYGATPENVATGLRNLLAQ